MQSDCEKDVLDILWMNYWSHPKQWIEGDNWGWFVRKHSISLHFMHDVVSFLLAIQEVEITGPWYNGIGSVRLWPDRIMANGMEWNLISKRWLAFRAVDGFLVPICCLTLRGTPAREVLHFADCCNSRVNQLPLPVAILWNVFAFMPSSNGRRSWHLLVRSGPLISGFCARLIMPMAKEERKLVPLITCSTIVRCCNPDDGISSAWNLGVGCPSMYHGELQSEQNFEYQSRRQNMTS
jgi:hypothetical protein